MIQVGFEPITSHLLSLSSFNCAIGLMLLTLRIVEEGSYKLSIEPESYVAVKFHGINECHPVFKFQSNS